MATILHILHAGSLVKQVNATANKFSAKHPDWSVNCVKGGSVDLVRNCISGDSCDLLLSADNALIETMMMPKYTDGSYIFCGNRIILKKVSPTAMSEQRNWAEVLTDPSITFAHFNPHADPGGYRAEMAIRLMDEVELGLSAKTFNHPGYRVYQTPADYQKDVLIGKPDYLFYYQSGVISDGAPYLELDPRIDLSSPDFEHLYKKAIVSLDPEGKQTISGSAIAFGAAIPFSAKNPKMAFEFANLFFGNDFEKSGFLKRSGIRGNWPPIR